MSPRNASRAIALCGSLVAITLTSSAVADPLALRTPSFTPGVEIAGGTPDLSAGGWITRHVGLAIDTHVFATLGLHVGTRVTLVGRELGHGLDLHASAGLQLLRHQLGVAGAVTGSLRVRHRWPGFYLGLGVVSNTSFGGSDDFHVRVPLRLELWLGWRAGPVWFGLQAGAGAAFVPPYSPSLDLQASLFVSIATTRR